MDDLSRGHKLLVLIGLAAILLSLLILSLNHAQRANRQLAVEYAAPVTPPPPQFLAVHVSGAVNRPGVYWLPMQARVTQAVAMAGGFRADADTASVNLAAFVEDGQQVQVKFASTPPEPASPPVVTAPPMPPAAPNTTQPAVAQTSAPVKRPGPALNLSAVRPVSLSTASIEQLEALPVVGRALAGNIIQHRTRHGPFTNVSDLLDVPGFGPERVEAVRPYVVP